MLRQIRHIQQLFPHKLVPGAILGVFAHPDDESLLVGGMFPLAHAEGFRTHLVTITRGELGGRFSGIFGEKLASLRVGELKRAAAILHICSFHHLSLPDKGVEKVRATLTDVLVDIISRNKPQIIVTHNLFDATEHEDHIATAKSTVEAAATCRLSEKPTMLLAAFKPNAIKTYALDIDPYMDTKIAACRAHASQGLLRETTLPIPLEVHIALHHFEYLIPYEKKTDHKRHHSDKK